MAGFLSRMFGKGRPAPARLEPKISKRQPRPVSVRRYKAAASDRISNFPATFNAHGISDDVRAAVRGLISHSRHVSQNNDYLKAFYGLLRRNVIGRKGIELKPQARKINGELDTDANRKHKAAWDEWARKGNCTVCGRYSWKAVQRIAISSCARDGFFLLRLYRGPQFGMYGFQVQILDALMLDLDMIRQSPDGGFILCGIECNVFGRPVAYHMFKSNPGRSGFHGERIRVPADDIVLLYNPYDLATSVLGVPWAHTALRRMGLLGDFEEAAVTNARWGASKMGFFVKDPVKADDEDKTLEPNKKGEAGKTSDKKQETGEGEGDEDDNTPGEPLIDEIEPGLLETLPEGWDFKGFDPAFPNGDIGPFNKAMLRGSAAGLGVAYSSLANDLEGFSYSGLRAGLGEERDEWSILQDWFAEDFCGPVHGAWLKMALMTGALNLPLSKIDKFATVSWSPRGWRSVNPKDDAISNQMDMKNLVKSPQEVCAEKGRSFEEVLDDFKEAEAAAAARGMDFWAMLAGGPQVIVDAPTADKNEE